MQKSDDGGTADRLRKLLDKVTDTSFREQIKRLIEADDAQAPQTHAPANGDFTNLDQPAAASRRKP